jgi:serine protease Do
MPSSSRLPPVLYLLSGIVLVFALSGRVSGEGIAKSNYEKAKAATVEILVNGHLNGSGWIADSKGMVLTAVHVVEHPDRKLEIASPLLGRKDAKLVAVDLGHDLALLSIEPRKEGYPALRLAEKRPVPGTSVFVYGTPLYRHDVLVPGVIASADTAFEYYADRFNEVMHISATVPQGMSGGPWLNMAGEVVGLQSGVMSQNSIPIGIAFAVPLEAIRTLLERRKTTGTPSLGLIAEELWTQDQRMINRFPPKTEGLVIKLVQADGPALRAGLKESDMIIAADGKRVRLIADLLRIANGKQPGQKLDLTILRPDGTGQSTATVILGRLEVAWP